MKPAVKVEEGGGEPVQEEEEMVTRDEPLLRHMCLVYIILQPFDDRIPLRPLNVSL